MIIDQFGNDYADNRVVIEYTTANYVRVNRIARNYIRHTYKQLRRNYGLSQKEARGIIWNLVFSFHLSESTTTFVPVERKVSVAS